MMEEVLASLPAAFTGKFRNLTFEVEDWHEKDAEPDGSLVMGTFRGIPLTQQSWNEDFPCTIVLYRKAHLAVTSSRKELRREIRGTLIHEIAHYFGISDERLVELDAY